MPTFLQAVDLPERCFLQEVLLWVAFQRLPIARYTVGGKELRETNEVGDFVIEVIDSVLSEDETQRARIPTDPGWTVMLEDKAILKVSSYDEFLSRNDYLDDDLRKQIEAEREDARAHERECEAWQPHFQRAIEYSASRIFVALKDGSLRAQGRLLPHADIDMARSRLNAEAHDIFDIILSDIPPAFWSLKGIEFDASAATDGTHRYCHISCRTEDVLSLFPGERSTVTVERVGDSYVLGETSKQVTRAANRGRPPYPWEGFHLEVAASIQRNELPAKKEAAIQHFQAWFAREIGVRPSRAAIGEKLTPYYERFVRRNGQKS